MRLLLFALTAAYAAAQTPIFAPPVTHISNGGNVTLPSTYWSAAADFNGDGRLDFAAPDNRSFDNILGFSVTLSDANGGYSAPVSSVAGFYVSSVCTADFNKDGRPDLFISGGTSAIALGNGDGTFAPSRFSGLQMGATAGANCATADLNNDGNVDILSPGSGGFGYALGNGDGTFKPAVFLRTPFDTVYVLTGDFNNDGKLDVLAVTNSVTSANSFLGNGDGTFQPPILTTPIPFGAQAGDFNNDGKLDLVMQTAQPRQDGSNFGITIALGLGDGQFVRYSSYIFQQPFYGLVVSDFNHDGKLDVATYMTSNQSVQVFSGRGDATLGPVVYQQSLPGGSFVLLGADVDGNGSKDLVVSNYAQFTIYRSVFGNPPLLAQLTLNPASVVGSTFTSATVTIGEPASAGGFPLQLSTSDPAAYFAAGNSVTIPAGSTSATFPITTRPVAIATPIDILATAGGVVQQARLDLVPPFSLASLQITPASQFGSLPGAGLLTLSGPASSTAIVSLTSSNPALAAVPATFTVPAGSTSVTFPIALSPVTANTPVVITARFEGITKTATVTVLSPLDKVTVSKSQYTVKSAQLKIEATSTSATATIEVYNNATGALIGVLNNDGKGKYDATFQVTLVGNAPSITLRSSLGGLATVVVPVK